MDGLFFTLVRRMRRPLITLVLVYAFSVLGFVLIPGRDGEGEVWHMSFFHAFYFVSYMGSTIGFGEIPHEFTDGQRLWTMVTIYATVITWLYGIGSLLALLQDPLLTRLVDQTAFRRRVRRTRDSFYLVCGYGVTGSLVVRGLQQAGYQAAVVDIDQARIDSLETDDLAFTTAGLCADAAVPQALMDAGLQRANCQGVLALTNSDQANLAIAITSKLLAPRLSVIARSETQRNSANLASFGTDEIIDPFVSYAQYLALALHAPYHHRVYDWLAQGSGPSRRLVEKQTRGAWVICGYGRFGRALVKSLHDQPVSLSLIDTRPRPSDLEIPYVQGQAAEAVTLEAAGIADAVGLVAGTSDDADNLSIVMTALELNPRLFTVARQNKDHNEPVFAAAEADLIMRPAHFTSANILSLLRTPLLQRFLRDLSAQSEDWARSLSARMETLEREAPLKSWALNIDRSQAPAVCEALDEGMTLDLRLLLSHPGVQGRSLPAICLLRTHRGRSQLLPEGETVLKEGDQVLFCGSSWTFRALRWNLESREVLNRLLGREERNTGFLGRWINGTRRC